MQAVETAVVGAGVGALTAAVGGKDISDGLLYGAAGGLVVGGLWELGKNFFDDFSLTKNQQRQEIMNETASAKQEVLGTSGLKTSISMNEKVAGGGGYTPAAMAATTGGGDSKGGGLWSKIGDESIAAGLQIGGSVLKGAFGGDTAEDKMVDLKEDEFEELKRQRTRAEQAVANYNVPQGTQMSGLTVAEQVKRNREVGFSKEAAGVNTGGALVGVA
jgi:hypothetical protein